MSDVEKVEAAALASARQRSLELLFDYTKFHIGLYLAIGTAYVTVASIKIGDKLLLEIGWCWAGPAVGCFALAGLAGGVIASSITQTAARDSREFLREKIGPWNWRIVEARKWTWVEHTSFWAGLVLAFLSLRVK